MRSTRRMEAVEQRSEVIRAVEEFQAGIDREKNYRFLVDRFYKPVRSFFARRVFSPDDCLDLTQETFLGLYKGLDGYRAEARFEYWLFRIAQTVHLKWLRTRKRREEISLHDAGGLAKAGNPPASPEELDPIVVTEETQLDDVLERERLGLLRTAIGELPEQMQRCVVLRVYQDRSYREIAEFQGISIETVKAHLFQGRRKLKEKLKDTLRGLDFE